MDRDFKMKKEIEVPDFELVGQYYKDLLTFTDKGNYFEISACVDGTGDVFKLYKQQLEYHMKSTHKRPTK